MKPYHVNTLFHPKTLGTALVQYPAPQQLQRKQQIVAKWVKTLKRGTLDVISEVSLHGEFLRDIFGEVLGYNSVIQGEGKEWTLHAEKHISGGGGSADGALGFFTAVESERGATRLRGRIVAPIELKGATNDLDRPAHRTKESAVDQGWRYARFTRGCRWVIVSNYREIRLYRVSRTPVFYERFWLEQLADEQTLRRFCFLLGARRFLPAPGDAEAESQIDLLLAASEQAEEQITDELYSEYKSARLQLVRWLQDNGPASVSRGDLIEAAQKILDRVLFIAFCEDRRLLPAETLKEAHDHADPYNPTPVWARFKAVFRWVDQGHDAPRVPAYNGGLFKLDPLVDEQIELPDELCTVFKGLARYDFDTEVSVEVLGRIFEQSVTDLEELKASAVGAEYDVKKGQRKTQGVYYTPAFITRYIVKLALGGYLGRKEELLRVRFGLDAIPAAHGRKLRAAEQRFWTAYRDEVLKKTRVLDPACGSGAFLIAAFDYLLAEYEKVNRALASYEQGQTSFGDLNKSILGDNLYGVDISRESVQITKLSLWLKTAQYGKQLTSLDHNIQHGNSIVADRAVDPHALDWQARFAQVFADGGFDVVLGNPPYVRQELLAPLKPYLEQRYRCFDGVADLYVYFYERGIEVLKPGGALSYIVTNKWLKASYGEALRRYFAEHTLFEQILDFGHAKIFADADVFPCIVLARKPEQQAPPAVAPVTVCPVPRELLDGINLDQYVAQNGYSVPWTRFTEQPWSLEHPRVDALMDKLRRAGTALAEYAGGAPYVGLKTGYNKAYLVDDATKRRLCAADPAAQTLLRPYLRGQDVRRWRSDWQQLWMILLSSSANTAWPWRDAPSADAAEGLFEQAYPAVHAQMKQHQARLEARSDQGRCWWELRSCAYLDVLSRPKIIWQDLGFHSRFCLDSAGTVPEMTCFLLPSEDPWLLAVLNSPLLWCYLWRNTIHGKDEVLRLKTVYMKQVPIAAADPLALAEVADSVGALGQLAGENQGAQRDLLAWLKAELAIARPGNALSAAAALDVDAFTAEVRRRRPRAAGKLKVSEVKDVQQAWSDVVPEMQRRQARALQLERRLSDLVNQAYGLTAHEVELMWSTAPPRTPLGPAK